MKIRTLIVDDEPLARERLQSFLREHPDIEIVGECADGEEAVRRIAALAPGLVLLDVQMPGLDGFGVLERLDRGNLPVVVFVTAHDQFALRAFEVHAVDYLLKPYDRERFQTAMQRAIERVRHRQSGDLARKLTTLLADVHSGARPAHRIAVKSSGRVVFVRVEDIDWIEAADNYVNLHAGKVAHLHRETMANMEKQLPESGFVRISRSAIVNVDRVRELQPLFHGEYAVLLTNGTRLTLSRSHRAALDRLMNPPTNS